MQEKFNLAIVRGVPEPPLAHLPYGSLKSSFNIYNQLIQSKKFARIDLYDEIFYNEHTQNVDDCVVRKLCFEAYGIQDLAYHVIYLSGGHFQYDSFGLRRNMKIPIIAEIGTTHYPEQWSSIFLSFIQGNISTNDGIIFKSNRTKEIFEMTLNNWSERFSQKFQIKSTVISNGVNIKENSLNLAYRDEFRKTFNLSNSSKLFLCYSRIAPNSKVNYEALIYSWAKISKEEPLAILVIAGAIVTTPDYREYPKQLLKLAKNVGVYENIRVIANPFDLWENANNYLMSGCDVFIHTTRGLEETTSNVVLEALSHSLPVIASNWSGMKDIIKDYENGFLIDCWTANVTSKVSRQIFSRDSMYLNTEIEKFISINNNQFISRVLELLKNPDLLSQMRKNSSQLAKNNYCIQKKSQERVDFFIKLANEAKSNDESTLNPPLPLVNLDHILPIMSNKLIDNSTLIEYCGKHEPLIDDNEKDIIPILTIIKSSNSITYQSLLQEIVKSNHIEIEENTLNILLQRCSNLNLIYFRDV